MSDLSDTEDSNSEAGVGNSVLLTGKCLGFFVPKGVQSMPPLSDLSETEDGNSEAGVGNSVLTSGNA